MGTSFKARMAEPNGAPPVAPDGAPAAAPGKKTWTYKRSPEQKKADAAKKRKKWEEDPKRGGKPVRPWKRAVQGIVEDDGKKTRRVVKDAEQNVMGALAKMARALEAIPGVGPLGILDKESPSPLNALPPPPLMIQDGSALVDNRQDSALLWHVVVVRGASLFSLESSGRASSRRRKRRRTIACSRSCPGGTLSCQSRSRRALSCRRIVRPRKRRTGR